MPEGHTIHRLAREHTRDLGGQRLRVTSPQGRYPQLAAALDGALLERIEARGKHLLYHWQADDGELAAAGARLVRAALILHVHLGLFGRMRQSVAPFGAPTPSAQLRLEAKHVAIELIGATTCELIDDAQYARLLSRLGPDLLADPASATDAAAVNRTHGSNNSHDAATSPTTATSLDATDRERVWQQLSRRSTPIATALLDQRILSGVGNVYRLEALFVCGIHPEQPSNSLSRAAFDRLWGTLRDMLRQGVEDSRIVTVHPSERADAALDTVALEDAFYVYKQLRCRRCGSPIRAWRLGARPAYACERCQPPPTTTPAAAPKG